MGKVLQRQLRRDGVEGIIRNFVLGSQGAKQITTC
jgi:hypothetical protein